MIYPFKVTLLQIAIYATKNQYGQFRLNRALKILTKNKEELEEFRLLKRMFSTT